MGWKDRPQTWIAGALYLFGVGVSELGGGSGGGDAAVSSLSMGDRLLGAPASHWLWYRIVFKRTHDETT
jgi:hypothetical protein